MRTARSYQAPPWAREARIIMMDKSITSKELAHALSVSNQSVAGVLTGNLPNAKLARRIREYLSLPLDNAV